MKSSVQLCGPRNKLNRLEGFRCIRGMGWLNSYLATGCAPDASKHGSDVATDEDREEEEEVGGTDTEKQHVRTLSVPELREALLSGRFLEVQWTATVSLALHHLEYGQQLANN